MMTIVFSLFLLTMLVVVAVAILRTDNLFNAQQRVTDDSGAVPLSYQPGFLNPAGRFVEIEFRKLF